MRQQWLKSKRADVLWVVAGVATLQLGLALALERGLLEWRDPVFGYKAARLLRRTVAAEVRPLTVVMLGTSRTAYGLQGRKLEERLRRELGRPIVAFNFGIPAGGPLTELLTLKRLLKSGVRPDFVLIEVIPPFLAGQPEAPREVFRFCPARMALGELPLLERYGMPHQLLRQACCTSWPVPWYAHRFDILSWAAPAWVPVQVRQDWSRSTDESGWGPFTTRDSSPARCRYAVERTKEEYAGYFKNFRLGGPSCQALHDLMELCRAEALPTALVLMPEGTDFRSWYTPPIWVQIQAFLEELKRKYAVPLINARDWVADEDFYDSHHMFPHGAAVFSERFAPEVLALVRHRASGGRQPPVGKHYQGADAPRSPASENVSVTKNR
jgi:hypothetical protein